MTNSDITDISKIDSITFREHNEVYKMIVGQLAFDGKGEAAASISNLFNISEMVAPSNKLTMIIVQYLRSQQCESCCNAFS